MDSIIRKFSVTTLKALIEVHRLHSEAIFAEFSNLGNCEQKKELESRWRRAIQAKNTAQLLLQLLERQEEDSAYLREASRRVNVELALACH